MRTDDRVIPHRDPFQDTESSPLTDCARAAGSALDASLVAVLTPQERLGRVTAALCARPLVLTNAMDLWISAVESLQRQGMSLAILGMESGEQDRQDIRIPPARHTLLVEGGVALIFCTSATARDLEKRVVAAQADSRVRAVLCAGVPAWIWHVTNEGAPKPVHGVRLIHEVAPPPGDSSRELDVTAKVARRSYDNNDN